MTSGYMLMLVNPAAVLTSLTTSFVLAQEEVDPRHALAAERTEGCDRNLRTLSLTSCGRSAGTLITAPSSSRYLAS